jgi:SpoVK/Ycf46/Vps4 family AAA+-type ATPase
MSSANAASTIDELRGIAGARLLDPAHQDWEELELSPRATKTVREIARRINDGKRVAALFSGPAGAGKTRTASLIARELDRQVIHIDLSQFSNERPTETEKALDAVFQSADPDSTVLLFDEAEALFGRSGPSHPDDPPSSTEKHFLDRIAEFAGLAIVATHQCRRIDPQLVRRLHYTIRV